jgi:hypothetical protein
MYLLKVTVISTLTLVLFGHLTARAQIVDKVWLGAQNSNFTRWDHRNNWSPSGAPTATDVILIDGTSVNDPLIRSGVAAGMVIARVTTVSSAVAIGGSGVTVQSGGGLTLSNFTLAADQTWTNNSANAFTVASDLVIASGRTLTIAGSNAVSMSAANTATVSAGGALAGTGTLATTTGLSVDGAISPGVGGIGTLSVDGDVTWNGNPGSAWRFDLGADNTSDLLRITGSFERGIIAGGEKFTFDFLGADVVGTFVLVSWAESPATNFTTDDFQATNLGGGREAEFVIDGNRLEVVVVPEPSTYALVAGMALLGIVVARRRR